MPLLPGPETAMLLQATVRAEQTVLRAGVESQEGMAHPYRASFDHTEPLLPTSLPTPSHQVAQAPCGHWVQSKAGSLGPVIRDIALYYRFCWRRGHCWLPSPRC